MIIKRLTSVSCGVAEEKRGNLCYIREVIKALDWIGSDDGAKEMLKKIQTLREQLE